MLDRRRGQSVPAEFNWRAIWATIPGFTKFDPEQQDATGAGPRGNIATSASEGNEPLGSISRQSQQAQRKLH